MSEVALCFSLKIAPGTGGGTSDEATPARREQRAPWEPRVPGGIGSADDESQFVDFKRPPPPA